MAALWETAAALSLPVFPCRSDPDPHRDKRPANIHGFKEAVTGRARVKELFSRYPGELIGVPTGAVSGFDVLDLDTARHSTARAFLQAVKLPATRAHQTQSGGLHILFRCYAGLRCSAGTKHRKGVDIRADGGYIIWWPAAGYAVNPLPIEPWPDNLVGRFLPPPPPSAPREITPAEFSDAKLGGLIRRVATAANGERNNLLFWGACRLGEMIDAGQIGRRAAEELLISAADNTGLDRISASRTIASGLNRPNG